MERTKKKVHFFRIRPESDKEQMALNVLYCLKNNKAISEGSGKEPGVTGDFAADYLNTCAKKGLLKASASGNGPFEFNKEHMKILGIGFRGGQCFLTAMDFSGGIAAKEDIQIDLLLKSKGRNKDISGIVRAIADRTKLRNSGFACCSVAIPEGMIEINPKSAQIFAKGISDIFGCEVFVTTSATAAGYGDRDSVAAVKDRDILYMHSDVGIGIVLKKEFIFEADESSNEKYGAYLRPWNQFSIVNTTKDLVSSGVGTSIVEMVKGDIDHITLDVVLEAARSKDELAEDLIKRSGLALGVRIAYLINMFNVKFVLFGGGIEKNEADFMQHVKESMNKFLLKDMVDKVEMVPGVLGKESSSIGAALLCRRETFMEV